MTPLKQFTLWFQEAEESKKFRYPNAMMLSTLRLNGYPDGRVLLLRGFDEEGFVFYTNSLSEKGQSLKTLPKGTLVFYWDALGKQIRIQGDISELSLEGSDDYFSRRPRGSQISAWASKQSEELSSRDELEKRVKEFEGKFEGGDVPRPPYWIGYCLKPHRYEFWEEREHRLHERTEYLRDGDTWTSRKLYP